MYDEISVDDPQPMIAMDAFSGIEAGGSSMLSVRRYS